MWGITRIETRRNVYNRGPMDFRSNALVRGGFLVLMLLVVACGGGGGAGGESAPETPTTPSAGDEPGQDDWLRLGAQFASMGTDALARELAAPGPRRFRLQPRDLTIRTGISFQTSYFCCGFSTQQYITVSGRVDVRVDDAGVVTVVETFGSGTLGWSGPAGTYTLELATDALQLTSQLVTVAGTVQPQQRFRLSGPVTYVLASGERKTTTIDVVLGYGNFSLGAEAPTAVGHIGPVTVSGSTLPATAATRRCECPGGPFPGAPPNAGCSIMCS